jgi:hypothetical protein
MIKSWYLSVRDETMAPARMVSFMEHHAAHCEVCLQDPDLKDEIAKITEMVLPESKIPKAIRQQNSLDDEEIDAEDDTFVDTEDENDDLSDEEESDVSEEIDPEEDEFLEDEEED